MNPDLTISTAGPGPDIITFKSNPAENIPCLPWINSEPLFVGTWSNKELNSAIIAGENTLALPSSIVIIETFSSVLILANISGYPSRFFF